MTWKSYVAMSGAGLLATYLVSAPPTIAPGRVPAAVPAAATPPPLADDIEEQAARLGSRVRTEIEYQPPARNPFRFGGRTAARGPSVAAEPVVASPSTALPEVAPSPPPPPPIRLTGIATSTVEGQRQRSAILLTPAGVVDAREGEMAGAYRVTRIEEDAVEVVGPDGVPRRLVVRP
jgi:hypothetical protein